MLTYATHNFFALKRILCNPCSYLIYIDDDPVTPPEDAELKHNQILPHHVNGFYNVRNFTFRAFSFLYA